MQGHEDDGSRPDAAPARMAVAAWPRVVAAAAAILASVCPVGLLASQSPEPTQDEPSTPAEDRAELPPLDLAALLREAEERSPVFAAAKSRRSAAETVPLQSEAYPDPLATVTYQNESFDDFTLGDSPDAFLAFSWTQEVPYPGKRDLAREAASAEMTVASRRVDRIRRDLSSRVKRTYTELYRIDQSALILKDSRVLLSSLLDTARARYEAGEGILENVLKAQTEISRLDATLAMLAQERLSTEASLNAILGRTGGARLGPAASLPDTGDVPDVSVLEEEALRIAPEVLEMEAAARRDEARLDLTRKQAKPDLMWGVMYANRGDLDPMISGTFGMRLPLYRDRRQTQAIEQASHEADAAKMDLAAARADVAAQVRDLAARAVRADSLSRLYAEGIIPQARSALESASASYGVGRVDYLTLLTDFTSVLTYELDYHVQRAERVAALADLERFTERTLVPVSGESPERGSEP